MGCGAAREDASSAKDYIAAVREYVEGTLRLMLRGVDPSIPTAVTGHCREKLSELHNQKIEPWSRPSFNTLLSAIAKGRKEIKWMEQSHHAGAGLNMTVDFH